MPFSKIRFHAGEVVIVRNETSGHDINTTTKTSKEAPRPELAKALEAFIPWVLEICDLETKYKEGLVVVSVNIGDGKNGGLIVNAHKKVSGSNAPMLIHTPHVPFATADEKSPRIPESVMTDVKNIEAEAEKYWNGERGQLALELGNNEAQPYAAEKDDDNSNREIVRSVEDTHASPKGEKGSD